MENLWQEIKTTIDRIPQNRLVNRQKLDAIIVALPSSTGLGRPNWNHAVARKKKWAFQLPVRTISESWWPFRGIPPPRRVWKKPISLTHKRKDVSNKLVRFPLQ
jgi:hypothetical protein